MDDADVGGDLRRELGRRLVEQGHVSAGWRAAFEGVPRHLFVPRYFRLTADQMRYEAVAAGDPGWLEDTYRDTVLPIQLDGDDSIWAAAHEQGVPVRGVATSSSTMPGLMAAMLTALDVFEGARVLELGTGSGYNAALLCHRLGADRVTSVDVDAVLVELAASRLAAAGFRPALAAHDGSAGHAAGAPYDRIIATVSVPAVPPRWIAQASPGALIIANLYRELGGDLLVRLRVGADGSAVGPFLADRGNYMPVRSQPVADPLALLVATGDQRGRTRSVSESPEKDEEFVAFAAIALGGVSRMEFQPVDGGPQFWLFSGDSWACHDIEAGTVEQYGDRRLWDELERRHDDWVALDRPPRTRLGLTVDPAGRHRLWLDEPARVLAGWEGHS
jgi:methyltransferase of ATP-grasp peptide maturase system